MHATHGQSFPETAHDFHPALVSPPQVPKLPVTSAPVDCHQVLQGVLRQLSRQIETKRLDITLQLSARGYLINGDRNRMQQIYQNLLSNAVTRAPKRAKLTVRSSCPTPDALRVQVCHQTGT